MKILVTARTENSEWLKKCDKRHYSPVLIFVIISIYKMRGRCLGVNLVIQMTTSLSRVSRNAENGARPCVRALKRVPAGALSALWSRLMTLKFPGNLQHSTEQILPLDVFRYLGVNL